MRFQTVVLIVLIGVTLASPGECEGASTTELVLQVSNGERPPEYVQRRVRLSSNRTEVIELVLGEEFEVEAVWVAERTPRKQYRVLERFRTSMTVMGEGPHLDLLNWRHHDSAWRSMRRTKNGHFIAHEISDREEGLFPKVSRLEMQRAVDSRARRTWPPAAELVRQCSGPNSYPCGVGVSSRYFRVQRKVAGAWVNVGTVEVRFPMGC